MSTLYTENIVFQNNDNCSSANVRLNENHSANSNNTIQLPADADDTLVGRATTDILTNKTVEDEFNTIVPYKLYMFSAYTAGARSQFLGSYPWNFWKIGNIVHLQWTTTNFSNATQTSVFYIPGSLPASFLPTRTIDLPIKVKAGSSVLWGNLRISSDPMADPIEIGATPDHGNFTSGQACGWYSGAASYVCQNE